MKGETVGAWFREVSGRATDPPQEKPMHRMTRTVRQKPKPMHRMTRGTGKVAKEPQERPRKQTPEGKAMTRVLAAGKPMALPRESNSPTLSNVHDDQSARDRAEGRAPLLPNERPVENERFRSQMEARRGEGYQRAGDYAKPYMPSPGFVVDSIAPSELTRQTESPSGAPDFRYGGATFPNDPRSGLSGTQSRYMAELERGKFGAPPLDPAVDPRSLGRNKPTPLELMMMGMGIRGIQR